MVGAWPQRRRDVNNNNGDENAQAIGGNAVQNSGDYNATTMAGNAQSMDGDGVQGTDNAKGINFTGENDTGLIDSANSKVQSGEDNQNAMDNGRNFSDIEDSAIATDSGRAQNQEVENGGIGVQVGDTSPVQVRRVETVDALAMDTGKAQDGLANAMDTGKAQSGLQNAMDSGKNQAGLQNAMDNGKAQTGLHNAMDSGVAQTGVTSNNGAGNAQTGVTNAANSAEAQTGLINTQTVSGNAQTGLTNANSGTAQTGLANNTGAGNAQGQFVFDDAIGGAERRHLPGPAQTDGSLRQCRSGHGHRQGGHRPR